MSVNWKGNYGIIEQASQQIDIDKDSVASATMEWEGPWVSALQFAMAQQRHPTFPFLRRKTGSIARQEANWSRIRINFAGVDPNEETTTFRCRGQQRKVGIEDHPDFAEWGTDTNGARFDKNDIFLGWAPVLNGEANPWAGFESFVAPGLVYEVSTTSGSARGAANNMKKIGRIDTPPPSNARPTLPKGYNWLFIGGDVEVVGDGLRIVRRWMASGPRGWSEQVYGGK